MTEDGDRHHWLTTGANVQMPWIIYGTAWKKELTAELVKKAVRAGFRGIDTACQPRHYREDLVGEALVQLFSDGFTRDELYIQTKYTPVSGQDLATAPYNVRGRVAEQVAQSFAVSLANLQVERLDTLLLHSPLPSWEETWDAWQEMERIQKNGGVRQLGISNCYSPAFMARLYDEAEIRPAVVQNRFYQESGYDVALRQWCVQHGVVYQSFWTLTANPHLLRSIPILVIAARYQVSSEEVLFRYLTQIGVVPLTGTCQEQHMSADLSIMKWSLTPDEVEQCNGLLMQ